MRRFILEIELRNDAMRLDEDIARALHKYATRINESGPEGKIMDINGNTVGHYEVRE